MMSKYKQFIGINFYISQQITELKNEIFKSNADAMILAGDLNAEPKGFNGNID